MAETNPAPATAKPMGRAIRAMMEVQRKANENAAAFAAWQAKWKPAWLRLQHQPEGLESAAPPRIERKPGVAPLDLHKEAAKSGWSARTIKGWYVGR